ncbi:hypothetical protein MBANPS3_002431 [Mucor bainieri]
MKFADSDSSSKEIWDPDAQTYYYYLSFLERYIEETKSIPPDLRKVYLVRAEYRYIKWLHNSLYRNPPTDVAFTWHAHMLNPRRYFEDKVRMNGRGLLNCELNLERWPSAWANIVYLHETQHHLYTTAESTSKLEWERSMGNEPYRLSPTNLLDAPYPVMTCIVCSDTITLEWEEYATWRTNPTSAVQCGRCDAMFTIKHVGKFNMITDLTKNRLRNEIVMAGLMFTDYERGANMHPQPEAAFFVEEFAHKFKSFPFNSGIYAIEDLLYDEEEDDCDRSALLCADVMDAIRSTYMCSPYRESSVDLLQAVSFCYKFAFSVIEKMRWDIPNDIHKGISQYNQLLNMLEKNKQATPTIYAEVYWHTCMMRRTYDRKLDIDKVFNYGGHSVPVNQAQRYAEMMTSKEKKTYKATSSAQESVAVNTSSKSSLFKGVFGQKSAKSEHSTITNHGLVPEPTFQGDDKGKSSVHKADYVVFDFPYTNANDNDYLNKWIKTSTTPKEQALLAGNPDYVTYSKENGSQKPRSNSTEEPWFHWQKAGVAWTYAKSKQEVENSVRRALEAAKLKDTPIRSKGYFTIYESQDYIPVGDGFDHSLSMENSTV